MINLLCGDALEVLRTLDGGIADTCVTSPPYFGLRNYGATGQIGMESIPEEYIARLVAVFSEVKRVLRDDGTLWLNIGDSYDGSGKGPSGNLNHEKRQGFHQGSPIVPDGCKPKDLIGIPWMLAFALRADGWYLRQDIIWAKPNGMPESVTDRCTKSHEYIFLLSKSRQYYFDAEAIAEPIATASAKRYAQDIAQQQGSDRVPGKTNGTMKAVLPRYGGDKYTATPDVFSRTKSVTAYDFRPMRNKRDVWAVCTTPYKGAHFATFPPELIRPCVRAGSRIGGIVLDPFLGSGTTGMVSLEEGRDVIGIDINPKYVEMAQQRCDGVKVRLPLEVSHD